MKILKIIAFVFFACLNLHAQQVYFVESYTEKGEPIGAKNEWQIKPWGSFIYIMLDAESDTLKGNILYLFIDKKENNKFQPFDSKAINIDYKQKWAVYNYKFTQTGEYDVYFVSSKQKRIASEKIKITYEETFLKNIGGTSRTYYDNADIVFSRRMLVGSKPLGTVESISIGINGASIYVLLNNFKPLNTRKILVDIWRKKNRSFDYDDFVESKKFSLNPNWPDTYFKYSFQQPGEYKFTIYNENEVLIKTGFFKVLN